jgi:hypothetical protein
MTQRILIAGGYGLVGGLIARQIAKAHPGAELLLGGRNPQAGAALAAQLPNARVVALDVNAPAPLAGLGKLDLVIAAVQDPADALVHAAMASGAAHIGITKTTDAIAQTVFAVQTAKPSRPVVLLGHWMAGAHLALAWAAAARFSRVDSIALTALFDMADPIGPMTAADSEHFVGQALVRDAGHWSHIDSVASRRDVDLDGQIVSVTPMGALDVPGLAALTGAPSVRFDLGIGTSLGTRSGGPASSDMYADLTGLGTGGAPLAHRAVLSDSQGQAHLTSLGVLVCVERVLGLDGKPLPSGGLHMPETLLDPHAALARLAELGVDISRA